MDKQSAKDRAIELVEEGLVSADDMIIMLVKWMTEAEVEECLNANELNDRFFEEDYDE